MDIVLIVGLFCALIFFMNHEKSNPPVQPPLQHTPIPPPPLPPKRFVSVVFEEGQRKLYDYFIGNNYDLKVNDFVLVPVRDKFTGESELKIAIVKYVSNPGERSERAFATVLRKVEPPSITQPPPTPQPLSQPLPLSSPLTPTLTKTQPSLSIKRFVQVIFKKRGKKRFDYLLGDNYDIKIGDFVVVHVNISGKTTWKIAKVVYISLPGEVSPYAKSAVIKKADYPKW